MNLFSVKSVTGKVLTLYTQDKKLTNLHKLAYFSNKRDAKKYRDYINLSSIYPNNNKCHVSKGPDHRHYTGS